MDTIPANIMEPASNIVCFLGSKSASWGEFINKLRLICYNVSIWHWNCSWAWI